MFVESSKSSDSAGRVLGIMDQSSVVVVVLRLWGIFS